LIIDEAQNLSPEMLEEVRLLSNLETPTSKLLQILLVGQPELNEMLARPELRQLRQRIVLRHHLTPFAARISTATWTSGLACGHIRKGHLQSARLAGAVRGDGRRTASDQRGMRLPRCCSGLFAAACRRSAATSSARRRSSCGSCAAHTADAGATAQASREP
jgi:hypothetical protein